jgi:hypothetical protein
MPEQILCEQCNNPVDPEEYGSYCELHRLNTYGCCRNHCLIEEGESERHCIHCYLSYPHVIRKLIEDISDIAFILGRSRLSENFNILLEHFHIDYSPELWAIELLHTITNTLIIDLEERSLTENMNEFILMVIHSIYENYYNNIIDIDDIIITRFTGLLREKLLDLVRRLFFPLYYEYELDIYNDDINSEGEIDPDIDPDAFYESNLTRVKSKNEQLESLSKNNIKLCEKCLIPTDEDLCNDCRNTD